MLQDKTYNWDHYLNQKYMTRQVLKPRVELTATILLYGNKLKPTPNVLVLYQYIQSLRRSFFLQSMTINTETHSWKIVRE